MQQTNETPLQCGAESKLHKQVLESLRELRLLKWNTGTRDRVNVLRGSALTAVSVHSKRMAGEGWGVLSAFMLGMKWAIWNAFPFVILYLLMGIMFTPYIKAQQD